MPRIERTKNRSNKPTREEKEAIARAIEEAPEGSEAAEWGARPDIGAGSLKPSKKGVTPG